MSSEPGSEVLDELETFVTAYLKRRFRPNLAETVALASYELSANAISYASVATDITFELWTSATAVEVEVVNDAVSARIDRLRQMVERIRNDPGHTYLTEMERSLSGRLSRASLGLARVAHEAGMKLDLEVDERRVKVIARAER